MDDLEQQQPPVEVVDDDPAYASGRRRVLQSPSHQLFEFGADGFTLTASTDGDDKDDVEHKREERSKAAVASLEMAGSTLTSKNKDENSLYCNNHVYL